MSTITRERAQEIFLGNGPEPTASEERELARIAQASLEAEPVAYIIQDAQARGLGRPGFLSFDASISDEDINEYEISVTPLYTAPQLPQPAMPDIATVETTCPDVQTNWQDAKMYAEGWNACRAAMLQGADRPQNKPQNIPENIPATQFKPVADLYGLTSPTGGETSFTFDAVEARDFVDGGWSCQEYVELERFQEAITNHTEDKLAMVDHSGDSNNMVERVSQSYKLPEEKGASLQLRNLIRKRHAEWSDSTFGNVGPIGPLKHLSKEALEAAAEPDDLSEWADMQFLLWDAQRRAGISDGEITAAMEEKLKVNMARQWPEPKDGEPRLHIKAAPQQEVTQALAKGMERYGDAMQKLADSGD